MKNYEVTTIKDFYGNDMYACADREGKYISVLENGYIILKTGEFVIIGSDHGASLTDFYNMYFKDDRFQKLSTFDIIPILTQEGFVVFLGTHRTQSQYQFLPGLDPLGFGILYFPSIESLTEEQKKSCLKLIKSNQGIVNPSIEKIKLLFGDGNCIQNEYSKEFIMQILSSSKQL